MVVLGSQGKFSHTRHDTSRSHYHLRWNSGHKGKTRSNGPSTVHSAATSPHPKGKRRHRRRPYGQPRSPTEDPNCSLLYMTIRQCLSRYTPWNKFHVPDCFLCPGEVFFVYSNHILEVCKRQFLCIENVFRMSQQDNFCVLKTYLQPKKQFLCIEIIMLVYLKSISCVLGHP